MATGGADSRQVRGRWVGAASAQGDPGVLRPSELDRLRRFGTTRFAEAGTVVAASGTTVTQVHVVASGEIELMTRLDEGRVTTAVVRTGGVVGDIPLLLGQPMPFDAVASRDTECVTLTWDRWTELLRGSPDLALRWMTSIARRLDDDRRRLVVVMSRPLVAQVAYLLLDMVEDAPGGPVGRTSEPHDHGAAARRPTAVRDPRGRRPQAARAGRHQVRADAPARPGRSARGHGRRPAAVSWAARGRDRRPPRCPPRALRWSVRARRERIGVRAIPTRGVNMQVRTITRASFAVLLTASLSGQAPEDGGDQSSPRRGCADSPLG